jgi:Flp pilus assembly protein TadB
VSKERARRRAERLAVLEKQKSARARRSVRRQRRRALITSLKPKRRPSSGVLYRRSRTQRTGIAVIPLVAALAVWLLIPDLALRLVLIAMIVLVLPALVVVVLGRRS